MRNKPHTLHVITKYFLPVSGGIENNIYQTHKRLKNIHGWNIVIHTSTDSYLQNGIFAENDTFDGMTIKRYACGSFGFLAKIDWKNADAVSLHNFDVFFIRYFFIFLWYKLTGRKKYSTFLSPHGGFNPKWSMFPPLSRTIKFAYTYTIGAFLVNFTIDKVRAISQWEKKVMSPYINKDKIATIDNGLEDEAYLEIDKLGSDKIKKQVEKYSPYFIQVARIYPIKNLETAIKAMTFIPKNIKFVIVGEVQDKAYEEKLMKLIDNEGLTDRVIFVGVIRGVDKYYLMKYAFAMVHMALWESYCNVVREGMSQGLPCIVSDTYALPYLIKNGVNGFSVSDRDHKLVAEKINWLLNPANKIEVDKMKITNTNFGKNNSWDSVASQMNTLYRSNLKKI